ncbi:MAG: hypothetical protein JWM81_1119 [Candidatus Saccharibacteria bacterium]|nr:hypothetical protein [Candidatus Saccharibacteria bacterium]
MPTTSSTTRTYITPSLAPDKVPKPPKKSLKLPTPSVHVTKKQLPWLITAVLVIISVFMFIQYRQAQNKLQGGSQNARVSGLLKDVSRVIILPTNETPTVATVTNAAKLANQSFFKKAQDGDKVIVYSGQKEAILYRPSTKQIVTVSTVSVSDGSSLQSSGR